MRGPGASAMDPEERAGQGTRVHGQQVRFPKRLAVTEGMRWGWGLGIRESGSGEQRAEEEERSAVQYARSNSAVRVEQDKRTSSRSGRGRCWRCCLVLGRRRRTSTGGLDWVTGTGPGRGKNGRGRRATGTGQASLRSQSLSRRDRRPRAVDPR